MLMKLCAVGAAALGVALAGGVVGRGSDSTSPAMKAVTEAYKQATGNTVTIEGGGSSKGAEGCLKGEVGFCFLSRSLKDAEKEQGLVGVTYGYDAVAVIVHKDNPVTDISIEDLKAIFTGEKTTWADGKPVVAFNRNEQSASRELFEHVVLKGGKWGEKVTVKHDQALLSTVGKVVTAVGFTSAGEIAGNKDIKVLTIGGVAPTAANIRSKAYPLSRDLVFATKGEPSGEVRSFFDFLMGEAGQNAVASAHYVPVRESAVASAPQPE